jgi:hypothetical protein
MSHSPGPWKFTGSGDARRIMSATDEALMGDERHYPWCPDSDEDWRLIAAAPDLLEACEMALDAFDGAPAGFSRENVRAIAALRDAIAKATSATPDGCS